MICCLSVLYTTLAMHPTIQTSPQLTRVRCCPKAKAFVESMHSETADVSVRADLLKMALKKHSSNTKLALVGQGVDRLMFGLQKISEESTGIIPDVFQTGAYPAVKSFFSFFLSFNV